MEPIPTVRTIPYSPSLVALQSLVSRRLDPTHAAVFSVGWMRSGSAENVIPGVAEAGFESAPPMKSCGSHDFGFYGRMSPTLMMFVGINKDSGIQNVPLHHPRFLPPEEAVGAIARAQAVAFVAAASSLDQVPLGSNGGEEIL
jgi:metal-dependent amidase/aminoacylase/carboxypeptidase family protein